MDGIKLDGLFTGLIGIGIVIGLIIWGLVELGFWLWSSDEEDGVIRTEQPITPDLEITVEDGVADTTYIYRMPE